MAREGDAEYQGCDCRQGAVVNRDHLYQWNESLSVEYHGIESVYPAASLDE